MARPTVEERQAAAAERELQERFPSVIVFSCRVLRPVTEYPYERSVWESEVRAPVSSAGEHVEAIAGAWVKIMEAGLELAKVRADLTGKEEPS